MRHSKSGVLRSAFSTPFPKLALIAICFSLPIMAHYYALIIPFPLNVDEAQWTASARTILTDLVFWRSSDLTTSGPLNGLAIAWPYLFGYIPSLYTSRLTALVLQGIILAITASTIRSKDDFGPASAAIIIAAGFVSVTSNWDLIHYSSELVSILLIASFCALYATGDTVRPFWKLALCGLIASSLPFAKLQSSLFCILFHGLIVCRLYAGRKSLRATLRDVAAYAALSLLPAIIFVAPLFLVGEQQAFFTGYLQLGAGYAGSHTFHVFVSFSPYIMAMVILIAIALAQVRRAARFGPLRLDLLVLGMSLCVIAALTVWLPGRPFLHYANYLIYCLPLGIAVARRAADPIAERRYSFNAAFCAAMVVISIATIVKFILPSGKVTKNLAASEASFRPLQGDGSSRTLFAWTGTSPQDSMLMWGWVPELTVYAELKPAGRSSHGEYLIRPNSGRDYFRDRLIRDLTLAEPALVIDAVRPDYFFTNYPNLRPATSEITSFPALFSIIQRDYDEIETPVDCAAVYLRHDKAQAWQRSEIKLNSDATALVDNSITERCHDWWAPDGGMEATATLTLVNPEPVKEVWILASRGGKPRGRGTNRISVRLVQPSGAATSRSVMLFDYPNWTVLQNDGTQPISRIIITTLSHVGAGAALNEVKAFRATGATLTN